MNKELSTEDSGLRTNESLPPAFKSWSRLYTLVLAELAFLILLFYLFMKVFE